MADHYNGNVIKFSPGGSSVTTIWVSGWNGLASDPIGLAFDDAGNLYAASDSNNTITRIAPDGSSSLFAAGGYVSSPHGLAFDSTGNLYVACAGNRKILKIAGDGTVSIFADTTFGLQGAPDGLAFDRSGNLFVVGSNAVEEFTPTGAGSVFASSGLSIPMFLTIVPEPSSWVLLGLSLPWLMRRYQRRTYCYS